MPLLNGLRLERARMHFGHSDGTVIYCNGDPLFFGMNAQLFATSG